MFLIIKKVKIEKVSVESILKKFYFLDRMYPEITCKINNINY